VVLGIGKSGHIGGKIAATLASTGTPAFFVHPAEANHGDLGMITARDVVLALSNSGESDEILTLLPLIKRQGVPLIALTGNPESTLAKAGDVHIDVSVSQEACPLGLAPTSSTTATLAMGDALAVSDGRCLGGGAVGGAGVYRRGLRPVPSGRAAGPPAVADAGRCDAHRRADAAQRPRGLCARCLVGDEPQGFGDYRGGGRRGSGVGRFHRRRPAPGVGPAGGRAFGASRRGIRRESPRS